MPEIENENSGKDVEKKVVIEDEVDSPKVIVKDKKYNDDKVSENKNKINESDDKIDTPITNLSTDIDDTTYISNTDVPVKLTGMENGNGDDIKEDTSKDKNRDSLNGGVNSKANESRTSNVDMRNPEQSASSKTGHLFVKKKHPFSKWRNYKVILDERQSSMNFFKAGKGNTEELSSVKISVDLKFIDQMKPEKPGLLGHIFPFKVFRKAGLSTLKLGCETEEERADWITAVEDLVLKLRSSAEREMIERTSQTRSLQDRATIDFTSRDSDGLIQPHKLRKESKFNLDSNQLSNIKLKRFESQENKKSNQTDNMNESYTPEEKFGVQLRRVNTEKAPSVERESSPELEEFKSKYKSLSLTRKHKGPIIPIKSNSFQAKTQALENSQENVKPSSLKPTSSLPKEEVKRKRSPSPNIPVSKNVEAFVKNSQGNDLEEKAGKDQLTVQNEKCEKNGAQKISICHAMTTEIQYQESEEFELANERSKSQNQEDLIPMEELDHFLNEIQQESLEEIEISEDASAIDLNTEESLPDNVPEQSSSNNVVTVNEVIERDKTPEVSNEETTRPTSDPPTMESKDKDIEIISIEFSTTNSEKQLKNEVLESTNDKKNNEDGNNKATFVPIEVDVTVHNDDENEAPDDIVKYVKTNMYTDSQNTTEMEQSSTENSPKKSQSEVFMRQESGLSVEENKSRDNSFLSMNSSESDDPLPRFNFFGRENSSTGSTCDSTMGEMEHTNVRHTFSGDYGSPTKEKPKLRTKRPDSLNANRSSLVGPEFTVLEEKLDDIFENKNFKNAVQLRLVSRSDSYSNEQAFKDHLKETMGVHLENTSDGKVKDKNNQKFDMEHEVKAPIDTRENNEHREDEICMNNTADEEKSTIDDKKRTKDDLDSIEYISIDTTDHTESQSKRNNLDENVTTHDKTSLLVCSADKIKENGPSTDEIHTEENTSITNKENSNNKLQGSQIESKDENSSTKSEKCDQEELNNTCEEKSDTALSSQDIINNNTNEGTEIEINHEEDCDQKDLNSKCNPTTVGDNCEEDGLNKSEDKDNTALRETDHESNLPNSDAEIAKRRDGSDTSEDKLTQNTNYGDSIEHSTTNVAPVAPVRKRKSQNNITVSSDEIPK